MNTGIQTSYVVWQVSLFMYVYLRPNGLESALRKYTITQIKGNVETKTIEVWTHMKLQVSILPWSHELHDVIRGDLLLNYYSALSMIYNLL